MKNGDIMVKNENTKNDKKEADKPSSDDVGNDQPTPENTAQPQNGTETPAETTAQPEKPTPKSEAATPEAERKPDATLSSDTLLNFNLGDYYEVVADSKGNPALERVEFNKLVIVEKTFDGILEIKARKEHIQGLNILSRLLIKNRKKIDDTILKKFHFWNVIGDNHELLLDSVSKLRLLKKIIDPLRILHLLHPTRRQLDLCVHPTFQPIPRRSRTCFGGRRVFLGPTGSLLLFQGRCRLQAEDL